MKLNRCVDCKHYENDDMRTWHWQVEFCKKTKKDMHVNFPFDKTTCDKFEADNEN